MCLLLYRGFVTPGLSIVPNSPQKSNCTRPHVTILFSCAAIEMSAVTPTASSFRAARAPIKNPACSPRNKPDFRFVALFFEQLAHRIHEALLLRINVLPGKFAELFQKLLLPSG